MLLRMRETFGVPGKPNTFQQLWKAWSMWWYGPLLLFEKKISESPQGNLWRWCINRYNHMYSILVRGICAWPNASFVLYCLTCKNWRTRNHAKFSQVCTAEKYYIKMKNYETWETWKTLRNMGGGPEAELEAWMIYIQYIALLDAKLGSTSELK